MVALLLDNKVSLFKTCYMFLKWKLNSKVWLRLH